MNDNTSNRIMSPVVVFAYNRVDKLRNCLDHLETCPETIETDLFIFCDGPKSDKDSEAVAQVQKYAQSYIEHAPFKNVVVQTQEINRGLAASVIDGVTAVVNKYGKVIVVEDDLVVLPSFLRFLNDGLIHYCNDEKCGTISAFTYSMKCLNDYDKDVFVTYKADCWGWATWADRWDSASWADTDFESYLHDRRLRRRFEGLEAGLDRLMYLQYKKKIDSWAIRWVYHMFCMGMLTVYPAKSRVINDGFDGSGTHCDNDRGFKNRNQNLLNVQEDLLLTKWEKCEVNSDIAKSYAKFPRRNLIFYIPETLYYMFLRN